MTKEIKFIIYGMICGTVNALICSSIFPLTEAFIIPNELDFLIYVVTVLAVILNSYIYGRVMKKETISKKIFAAVFSLPVYIISLMIFLAIWQENAYKILKINSEDYGNFGMSIFMLALYSIGFLAFLIISLIASVLKRKKDMS